MPLRKVIVARDNSLWAREHSRYIASVLAGNGAEVIYIDDPMGIGTVPDLLVQEGYGDIDLVVSANEGGRGRNFGIQIYTRNGSFSKEDFDELYSAPGGINSFADLRVDQHRRSREIHFGRIAGKLPVPRAVAYRLPGVNLSKLHSTAIWFPDRKLMEAMGPSFAAAQGDGVNWQGRSNFIDVPGAPFRDFEDTKYLTDGAHALAGMLRERPEKTAVVLNANGSRVGVAEKLPRATAAELEKLGAVLVGDDGLSSDVIVHYPPFLLWTILAALYADEFKGKENGDAFAASFPVSSNVEKIARSRGLTFLRTDISEGPLGRTVVQYESAAAKNRVLLTCEPTGNGNAAIIMSPRGKAERQVARIGRQSNSFAAGMMLLYFKQRLEAEDRTFGDFLLSIPESFGVALSQGDHFDIRQSENPKVITRLQQLKKGKSFSGVRVASVEHFGPASQGLQIILENGARISMYHSYKATGGTFRVYLDAPSKVTIEAMKGALGLPPKRAPVNPHDRIDGLDRSLVSA